MTVFGINQAVKPVKERLIVYWDTRGGTNLPFWRKISKGRYQGIGKAFNLGWGVDFIQRTNFKDRIDVILRRIFCGPKESFFGSIIRPVFPLLIDVSRPGEEYN